jgi:D-hydroxyproline dehydrogenase subunit beta
MNKSFDIAIVGAGIVGLAHAWAAAKAGKRVVVFDREPQSNGASVRNFGLVSVTGQRGVGLQRALRTRDIWLELALAAGIPIDQRGLLVAARRPETKRLLEAFAASPTGGATEVLTPERALGKVRVLQTQGLQAALWAPDDIRVECRLAVPRLTRWLAEQHGVEFRKGTLVKAVQPPLIETTTGIIRADAAIVCPGDDLQSLFADRIAHYKPTRCKLQMLRIKPGRRISLGASVISDLGLLRLPAFAELPEADRLRGRIESEQRDAVESGLQLTVVQSPDGSLVVGASHTFGPTVDGIGHDRIDQQLLDEFDGVFDLDARTVSERWTGSYPWCADRPLVVDRPSPSVRLVMNTGGTGFSTAFAIAEEVVGEMFGTVGAQRRVA